nr:MAG TPA: hypothetical protein [Caudoviricetes sp.]
MSGLAESTDKLYAWVIHRRRGSANRKETA